MNEVLFAKAHEKKPVHLDPVRAETTAASLRRSHAPGERQPPWSTQTVSPPMRRGNYHQYSARCSRPLIPPE